MNVSPKFQRLLFMGKQMEDSYNLFDYSVKVRSTLAKIIQQIKFYFSLSGK